MSYFPQLKWGLLLVSLLSIAAIVAACGKDGRVVKAGDAISVHYVGTLDDGSVFDSSRDRDEPFSFTVGSGQVIAGFDNAVLGMAVGDKKTVRLRPEEAYGEWRQDLVFDVPLENAPQGLVAGDRVHISGGGEAVVLEVTDKVVRIDANPRLAGQALTFEIEIVSID
mgnify:CR=1 FL=1